MHNEDEHLAKLEAIFLFLCPQMLQCLFLFCCTTLTQGIKLCCLHCQLGVELSFCNQLTLNFTCCKQRADLGPGHLVGSLLCKASLAVCPGFHFWQGSCAAVWLCRAGGRTPTCLLLCYQLLSVPPPMPSRKQGKTTKIHVLSSFAL